MHIRSRVFDWTSQEQFARASGDRNPIHMDVIAARRTHAGAPIVHGIHTLAWLLDCLALHMPAISRATSLKAQFSQPVYIDDEVTLDLVECGLRNVRARLLVGSEEVLIASLAFDERPSAVVLPEHSAHTTAMVTPPTPHAVDLEEMERIAGCIAYPPNTAQIEEAFGSAVAALGMQTMRALFSCSSLVGMVVPGLHSLFSGLEVWFAGKEDEPTASLRFSVLSVVTRFRLVRIGIAAQGLRGTLETVSRMPPVRQSSVDEISRRVGKGEFSGCTALIAGGSRGLGEITAKLIAAGGGHVVVTYAGGKADAQEVVDEIRAAGLTCAAVAYDARRPAFEQLAALNVVPTHMYYFATPPIFRRKAGLFDAGRFDEFNRFYVSGFFQLVQACLQLRPKGIKVFYPSSTALDARPATMTEYSMSKAAGEVLCVDLTKFVPGVNVLTRRLPRLPTDQTNSIVQTKTSDPIDVLLEIVREMNQHI